MMHTWGAGREIEMVGALIDHYRLCMLSCGKCHIILQIMYHYYMYIKHSK